MKLYISLYLLYELCILQANYLIFLIGTDINKHQHKTLIEGGIYDTIIQGKLMFDPYCLKDSHLSAIQRTPVRK